MVAVLIFVYALVKLVVTKHNSRPGDVVIVGLPPPRIEIRYGEHAPDRDPDRLASEESL
ncbi:hypothetical protein OHB26_20465 [Nocardia sp. NBC_01503]|uniref:hypothetical protein n=1 Tax=Nocardia sp. NBC_01503 TaxID=2975997 RepID=UPI002E7ADB7D|nr:hypothetical protein [Nocardia sp. NBC_01503]WTL29381.1 hypothetical protein OHB26_20465 [Nocardia sp. NBC_01503]